MTKNIALAGNPNCGKTTLFNKLTGSSQRVGNWPGVTIDKKVGKIKGTDGIQLVDLPGIYSMSPYSPEETVSRDYLIYESPDAIVNIVDATNLERNLFLTMQIMETGIPVIVALNMMDVVAKNGDSIDSKKLSEKLGCPVVPISALKGDGVDELIGQIKKLDTYKQNSSFIRFDDKIESLIHETQNCLRGKVPAKSLRWFAVKLIENDEVVSEAHKHVRSSVSDLICGLEEEYGDDMDSIIANSRYEMIAEIVSGSVRKNRNRKESVSDKIDRIATSRIWGFPLFIGVIGTLFLGIIGFGDITGIGTYLTDLLNGFIEDPVQSSVEEWCVNNNVSEALAGLLVNGIIGGVGAVIGFLPQMLILFVALCILEDIGYMSRIAFVMDRIFRYFGLSGKSFIPVLVGTGCGVPGIMSSRTIESDRDRRITAMTVTFIPCGAKLPVIAMIAGALFGGNGLVALFCYVLGIACVLVSGIILKKLRSLSGTPAPFIMELPPYHVPSWMNVFKGTFDRGMAFVKKAGTIILLASVAVWFLASFNLQLQFIGTDTTEGSILANIGSAICILFQPLGWGDNWELTVGTFTGLIAKENIVGTFGTLFGIEAGESGEGLEEILSLMLTPAAGLGFLAFNMICAPCFAAIGAMRRELGTWKSTAVAVGYQCCLAYGVALMIYVVAGLITGVDVHVGSIIFAAVVFAGLVYLLAAKDPFRQLNADKPSVQKERA